MPMIPPATSYHTFGFFAADTAGATLQDIAAISNDGWLTKQNNHYWAQEDTYLLWAYVRDAGVTLAQISTPDYRRVAAPAIFPLNRAAAPTTLPNKALYAPNRITIPKLDEIALLVSNNGAGGVDCYGVITVESKSHNRNVPAGDVYTLHATSAITRTAAAWTTGALIFDSSLPAGTFSVVGLGVVGATTEAARLAFSGGGMKPGVLVQPTSAAQPWPYELKGGLGEWGRFVNSAPPSIEVLGTAGGAVTYDVFLDVVIVGPA